MRYVLAIMLCLAPAAALGASPQELLDRVQSEGLKSVASRPETLRDRDLGYLDLIASLTGDSVSLDLIQEARDLRGMPPIVVGTAKPGYPEGYESLFRSLSDTR
jgi:hypothetical protein